jgi:hypothetical protein
MIFNLLNLKSRPRNRNSVFSYLSLFGAVTDHSVGQLLLATMLWEAVPIHVVPMLMSLLLLRCDPTSERNLLDHIPFYKWSFIERVSSNYARERVCDPL